MKLLKDPLFIGASLLLFFPLGLLLILRSEMKRKAKFLFITFTASLNILMLIFALYRPPANEIRDPFQISVSRNVLEVGQSGSVTLQSANEINPGIELIPENDNITVSGSVFTAQKVGQCTLTVRYDDQIATIPVTITADNGGKEIVYLTQSGARYHKTKEHCRKNILTMTQEEAIQSGKTPCKNCY